MPDSPRKTRAKKEQIAVIARRYTKRSMRTLWSIAQNSPSDAARVAAIKTIFEYGHGKPPQAVTLKPGDDEKGIKKIEVEFI